MSKVMSATSLPGLLERIAGEYRAKRSIYEIPETFFRGLFELEASSPGLAVMGGRASLPVGPAAGPHSQLAACLVAAYLAGARVFELKTVQANDALDIEKPCIDALDEGHNTEWSSELSLVDARREYLHGWLAVNLLAALFSPKPSDFMFNMSVGYSLDGIRSAAVDAFIEGLRHPAGTSDWARGLADLKAFVEGPSFRAAFGTGPDRSAMDAAQALLAAAPDSPVHSVTLSTMHGCPPDEIGRIGRYLLQQKNLDVYIKLNPTLLGYDAARTILDATSWTGIEIRRESFEHDLQWKDALGLIASLNETARAAGRQFGIKLSNTLANRNHGGFLPGAERYLSGRALYPLTIRLAAELAAALPDFGRRFSYCGGAWAGNAAGLIRAGLGPITAATDILKPGGLLRLGEMARAAAAGLSCSADAPDPTGLARLAEQALTSREYKADWKKGRALIEKKLPLFDCFAAPCIEACPAGQQAPAYIRAAAAGDSARALAIIIADNPLPFITGTLCDHVCQETCARNDYEGPVEIRACKLACARTAALPVAKPARNPRLAGKVAIVGAGPAGLACAHYLSLAGAPPVVFDAAAEAGGVPANVIPRFRIPRVDLRRDIERIRALGAEFRFGVRLDGPASLLEEGFTAVFLACGADRPRELTLAGRGPRVIDALSFLAALSCDPGVQSGAFADVRRVVVAGGGNTAADSVRSALRLPGVEQVILAYRRSRREMPADREELETALAEGGRFMELVLPESAAPAGPGGHARLVLRKMLLGEVDASGRRAPLPSPDTLELDCDLLVSAIGEAPDRELLEAFGLECSADGRPLVDPTSLAAPGRGGPASRRIDLFVGGDARRGPASIIAALADGKKAALAILRAAGIQPDDAPAAGLAGGAASDAATPEPADPLKLAGRGRFIQPLRAGDPEFMTRESERCLACDTACLRCVEVCPNRANLFIPAGPPFRQAMQILHVDALCNECGNCGRFCPWQGDPCKDKPTIFANRAGLAASRNPGFAFESGPASRRVFVRPQSGGPILERGDLAGTAGAPARQAAGMLGLAALVLREHAYLIGEAQ